MNLLSVTFSMTAMEKIFHAHMLDKCRKLRHLFWKVKEMMWIETECHYALLIVTVRELSQMTWEVWTLRSV